MSDLYIKAPSAEQRRPPVTGKQDGVPDGMRRCTRCEKIKTHSEFAKNVGTKSGLHAYCNDCQREKQLEWRYGISMEQYNAILEAQGGVCALCGSPPRMEHSTGPKRPGRTKRAFLKVDHCHETGRIRGLLCTKCNVALGSLGDTVEALEKALRYVRGS